ncbi:MAG: exodeoxyribonuclease VII small subunit [Oscillospiraceae bacterium]|nr:exodeoxyribonuclease VII small subunit [Oscillospiraceae bacterium]
MKLTFEQAMERLEEISRTLSENQVSIDQSLELYAEGTKLIKFCSEKLKTVSLKIEEIDSEVNEGV